MLRSWQGCFLLTACAFVLQLLPPIGVFLMMLAAPFWSVVLINLGFALMARDAWTDPAQRWLLVFPLLWFGGYAVVAAYSHWQVHRYNASIAAANADKHVAFDPRTQDLVIEPDPLDESRGSPLRAETFIRQFGLDRVFAVTNRDIDTMRGIVLEHTACPDQSGAGTDGSRIWNRLNDGGYPTDKPMVFAQSLCLFFSELRPQKPAVRVRPQPQVGNYDAYDAARVSQNIAVISPDGTAVLLRSGSARPLSWLPQPVMGCALDSGAPAWHCFAAFTRESFYSPKADRTPQAADNVVARALRLRRVTIRERYPAGWR